MQKLTIKLLHEEYCSQRIGKCLGYSNFRNKFRNDKMTFSQLLEYEPVMPTKEVNRTTKEKNKLHTLRSNMYYYRKKIEKYQNIYSELKAKIEVITKENKKKICNK